jgi:hypothetical protein
MSGAGATNSVTELSVYGCYFDMVNPFPADTSIPVKIVNDQVFFEARGIVPYLRVYLGKGLAFL